MNPSNPFDLTGKVAVVTGASRGIGAAVARALAGAGAQVVLTSRKQAALDEVAASIRDAGGTALAVAAHTGDDSAIGALMQRVAVECGGVDILVNNAATNPHYGPVLTAEESHWDKTFDVNVKGYVRMVRACMDSMQSRGGGSIINMASIAGMKPEQGMGVYAVTKAGVLMLTQVLAVELAPLHIRVNALAPGYVKTQFSSVIWQSPHVYPRVKARIPQGRMAEPDELTGIVLYLASDAASFTTGATFTVDGGNLLG